MKKIFIGIQLILMFSACSNEEKPISNIDGELKPYIDDFFDEAQSRGLALDQILDASFIDEDVSYCGQGNSPSFNNMIDRPTLFISRDCWSNYNDVAKEMLIFHELGHAVLNRIHIDELLPNNYSKSLMCAGRGFNCSDAPNYLYCSKHREYYVDELFNINTPTPAWALKDWTVDKDIYTDLNSTFVDNWQVFTNCQDSLYQVTIDSVSMNRPSDYSLKIESRCNDYITVRKRLDIQEESNIDAVQLACNVSQSLVGEGVRVSIYIKSTESNFTSFKKSNPSEMLALDNANNEFDIRIECIESSADSMVVDFQYFPNTTGDFFVGNLEIKSIL